MNIKKFIYWSWKKRRSYSLVTKIKQHAKYKHVKKQSIEYANLPDRVVF